MFPIYFYQFVQNSIPESTFISDLIVATVGSLVGTGGALLLFFYSNKRQLIEDGKKRDETQEHKLYYFASLLKSSIRISHNQCDNIEKFIEDTRKTPLNLPAMNWVPMNDINRIVENLNLEEYFLAYTLKFVKHESCVTEFRNIISTLDFLKETFLSVEKLIKGAFEDDIVKKKQLESDYKSVGYDLNTLYNYILVSQPKIGQQLIFLNKRMMDTKYDPYDLETRFVVYIEPLKKIFEGYTLELNDVNSLNIYNLKLKIHGLCDTFEYIKSNNYIFADKLAPLVPEISKQVEEIERDSIKILKLNTQFNSV